MRIIVGVSCFLLLSFTLTAQENTAEKSSFWSRIFLPSIDAGYQVPNTDLLEGSVRIGTSIEYRIKNNNDFFVRVNYDTYGAKYKLANSNAITNTIEGSVQFTDVVFGPGYRFGDNTFRLSLAAMPGMKLYEFPKATLDEEAIIVLSESRSIFTTIFLTSLEYYIDQKSALTLSLYQNQVWDEVDFWENGGSSVGFSIGFITSLL